MAKVNRAQRVQRLAGAFARIRVGLVVTDSLLNNYFTSKADEIEAFNAELQETLTPVDETPEVTTTVVRAAKRKKK